MGAKGNYAEEVRKFVTAEFEGVGEFRTRDVVQAMANSDAFPLEVDSGYVSASLTSWSKHKMIVAGRRLLKKSGENKTSVWEIVPAKKDGEPPAVSAPPMPTGNSVIKRETFHAEIIHKVGGKMLVQTEHGLFKVEPYKL